VRGRAQVPYPRKARYHGRRDVFTSDLGGCVRDRRLRTAGTWKTNNGSSICEPFSTSMWRRRIKTDDLVVRRENQQTANCGKHRQPCACLKLGATQTVGSTPPKDRRRMAAIPPSAKRQIAWHGSARQKETGRAGANRLFGPELRGAKETSCKGISAPALTVPSFAKSHLKSRRSFSVASSCR